MGVPLATKQSDTWAACVVSRFSFDKNSPNPNAQKKPSPAAVSTTSTKSTAISTTPANDNASINSGSTLATGPSIPRFIFRCKSTSITGHGAIKNVKRNDGQARQTRSTGSPGPKENDDNDFDNDAEQPRIQEIQQEEEKEPKKQDKNNTEEGFRLIPPAGRGRA
jgi:hypothetical protein